MFIIINNFKTDADIELFFQRSYLVQSSNHALIIISVYRFNFPKYSILNIKRILDFKSKVVHQSDSADMGTSHKILRKVFFSLIVIYTQIWLDLAWNLVIFQIISYLALVNFPIFPFQRPKFDRKLIKLNFLATERHEGRKFGNMSNRFGKPNKNAAF